MHSLRSPMATIFRFKCFICSELESVPINALCVAKRLKSKIIQKTPLQKESWIECEKAKEEEHIFNTFHEEASRPNRTSKAYQCKLIGGAISD